MVKKVMMKSILYNVALHRSASWLFEYASKAIKLLLNIIIVLSGFRILKKFIFTSSNHCSQEVSLIEPNVRGCKKDADR